MRAAIGFGLLVTAALVGLEAATGIPRGALNEASTRLASTAERSTAAASQSAAIETSNVYDPIPAIARTVAIAEPSRPMDAPLERSSASNRANNDLVATRAPNLVPENVVAGTVIAVGTAAAIVPPARRIAPASVGGSKADRMAIGPIIVDKSGAVSPTKSANAASRVPTSVKSATAASKSDRKARTAKSAKTAAGARTAGAKASASHTARGAVAARAGKRDNASVVVVRRGVEARLVSISKSVAR